MSTVLRFSLILIGAAVLAVIARFLFINSEQPKADPRPNVQIRTAAAELPAGLLLRDTDLAWKTVRPEAVPQGAIVQGSPQAARLSGALLRNKLANGAVVLSGNIIQPDAPGFLAAVLAPGMRAVSVAIDDVSGNAGLIQPGDHVDMLLIQNMQRGPRRAVVGETVVENVRIIAVGSTFSPQRDASGNANRARTITVEVTPSTAEAVTVASHLGTLSLALRSFATTDRDARAEDVATVVAQSADKDKPPVWGGDVSRALKDESEGTTPPAPSGIAPPPKRSITLMRGSNSQELSF